MFNLGFFEILMIVILAVVFIGPEQMPDLARNIGKIFRDLKKATNEVTDSLQREVRKIQNDHNELKSDLTREIRQATEIEFKVDTSSVSTSKNPEPTKNDETKS